MKRQEFRDEGWHSIEEGQLPPSDTTVEFARDETVHRQEPWFGKWGDLHPAFNVAGLWWRVAMNSDMAIRQIGELR